MKWLQINMLFEHRAFLFFAVIRELRAKYRNPVFGILWALGQPLMLSFLVNFALQSRLSHFIIQENYFFFCFSGLTFWAFLSASLNQSTSVLSNRYKLIKSTEIPPFLVAITPVISAWTELIVHLTLSCLVFSLLEVTAFSVWHLLPLIISFIWVLLFGLAASLWVSSLCIEFADLRPVIPFFLQIVFLSNPIIFEMPLHSKWSQWLLSNPFALSLKLFRWGIGLGTAPSLFEIVSSSIFLVLLMSSGVLYFRKKQRDFVELI